MISADISIKRIFVDDFGVRFPDIKNTTNPSDRPQIDPIEKAKAFATRGNVVMATSLLGGSIGACAFAFLLLPWIFPAKSFSRTTTHISPTTSSRVRDHALRDRWTFKVQAKRTTSPHHGRDGLAPSPPLSSHQHLYPTRNLSVI